MERRGLAGLIALNIVLLGTLALLCILPAPAQGQFAGNRRPGDYVMISVAQPERQSYNAVVITDLNNAAMLAVRYDQTRKDFVPLAFHNIASDAESRQAR